MIILIIKCPPKAEARGSNPLGCAKYGNYIIEKYKYYLFHGAWDTLWIHFLLSGDLIAVFRLMGPMPCLIYNFVRSHKAYSAEAQMRANCPSISS